eukprot:9566947-Alexandrium_andersonii.AAC.1
MSASLVGSEMCIRDSAMTARGLSRRTAAVGRRGGARSSALHREQGAREGGRSCGAGPPPPP